MSSKSRYRFKKLKAHVGEPRLLAPIQTEYQQALLKAGELQFKVAVMENDLKALNKRLGELHMEAGAREKLDRAKASNEGLEGLPVVPMPDAATPIEPLAPIQDDVHMEY